MGGAISVFKNPVIAIDWEKKFQCVSSLGLVS